MADIGSMVMSKWNRTKGSALGRWLFSRGLGRFAPYTGTIAPRIQDLSPGRAVVAMRDRKAVRNHLHSIHAAAMGNLIELTGSLTVITALHPGMRMIPVHLEVDFLKKARGEITASGECGQLAHDFDGETTATVVLTDPQGDEVARGLIRAAVGPAE
jgi:acyl-coenzyme A thioesterase PaaI-like protein